nr:hypothetical protein [Tanacetum cinerariifolium]
ENTHPEGNLSDETDLVGNFYENSEFNFENEDLLVNTVRRSSRQTKLPISLNDFIIRGKVKYGIERVVNYFNLSSDNFSFASSLNKSIKPTCCKEAILDNNSIDAMNDKLEALNRNHTWIITNLHANRNPVGYKWIFKIKYKENGEIERKYCLELLKEYGVLRCKPVSTPLEPNSVLSYTSTKTDPLLDNITGYQKLLGKLIYLTHTRPDIAYSVHYLAQYIHFPLKSHLNCALNVLRYIKNAPGKDIKYVYADCNNNPQGYCNADWTKCLKTTKSVT